LLALVWCGAVEGCIRTGVARRGAVERGLTPVGPLGFLVALHWAGGLVPAASPVQGCTGGVRCPDKRGALVPTPALVWSFGLGAPRSLRSAQVDWCRRALLCVSETSTPHFSVAYTRFSQLPSGQCSARQGEAAIGASPVWCGTGESDWCVAVAGSARLRGPRWLCDWSGWCRQPARCRAAGVTNLPHWCRAGP
jgi:hypothetical protein